MNEFILVDGLLEDTPLLDACLLGDAHQQRVGPIVQQLLVDFRVLMPPGPLKLLDGLPREHRLVDVDDPPAFSLGVVDLLLLVLHELRQLSLQVRLAELVIVDCLLLDAHPAIDLAQERWV